MLGPAADGPATTLTCPPAVAAAVPSRSASPTGRRSGAMDTPDSTKDRPLSRRRLLKALGTGLAAVGLGVPDAARAQQPGAGRRRVSGNMVLATWGGRYSKAMKDIFLTPFSQESGVTAHPDDAGRVLRRPERPGAAHDVRRRSAHGRAVRAPGRRRGAEPALPARPGPRVPEAGPGQEECRRLVADGRPVAAGLPRPGSRHG